MSYALQLDVERETLLAKRAFDIILSLLALPFIAAVGLVIAVLIKLDSPGPVFFRQWRVGRHGHEFRIHKFRTMVADASERGPALTMSDDARVTRVGRMLRRRRLDELPQFIDVLSGHMSVVGPRPEVPRYAAALDSPLRDAWLALKPGMTDPASLAHMDEDAMLTRSNNPERDYVERILPMKVQASVNYAQCATLRSDACVVCRTFWTLARP